MPTRTALAFAALALGVPLAACDNSTEKTKPTLLAPADRAETQDQGIKPPPAKDATPPETLLVSAPEALTGATEATLVFAGSDNTAIAKFECRIHKAAFSTCTSPYELSGLGSGLHQFAVRAIDTAGNVDATAAEATWVVDSDAPQTSIDAGPALLVTSASATFAFSATDAHGIRAFYCRLNDAPFETCTSPTTVNGLAAAQHTFEVYAIDTAGNRELPPSRYAWRISEPPLPAFVPNVLWTERLGQLVGTTRSPYGQGIRGTDLGVTFPRNGKQVILFGDSWTTDGAEWDIDSVAYADPQYPTDGYLPHVTWHTRPGGRFLPLGVPGVALGGMNVPVDGFAVGATTYVFFSTGYDWGNPAKHTHSVLAHTTGFNFATMTLDHMELSTKFININVIIAGDNAYLFGSGHYRKSAIYLARAPLATITDRSSWEYYQSGSGDAATFGPHESSAAVLVNTSDVGEFSVRKHPKANLYFMTYQTGGIVGVPRGVHLRTATSPAGPWSAPVRIWNPDTHGYTYFMHAASNIVGYDDGLSEPGRENEWGGEYGPYFVPEWFDAPGTPEGAYSLVYLLSSWNPYTVHLIRTVLGPPGLASQPVKGVGLPWPTLTNGNFADGLTGWSASGHTFRTFSKDGLSWVTTFTENEGDNAIGQLWQDFTVNDSVNELRFRVHGGHAAVKLIHDGNLVFATRGRDTNDSNTQVRWKLADYRGETVRLVIDDDTVGSWGFISASGFTFH
jgi:hypothetical protein